jgi:acyl carrier protein
MGLGGEQMADGTSLEKEVAALIVETLNLEIKPGEIEPAASLFGEGLGLDSIDALELALAISKNYGFQLRSDDSDNIQIFSSLRALSSHIGAKRVK